MSNTIAQAKEEFLRAQSRTERAFAATPDDRINWSPAPSARTPAQLVAHAALSVQGLQQWMEGHPFPHTPDEADKMFRESEKPFDSREKSQAALTKACAEYVAWLDSLTPERLESVVEMPFGIGDLPVSACLGFAGDHMNSHLAQIEYIQTSYGDRKW